MRPSILAACVCLLLAGAGAAGAASGEPRISVAFVGDVVLDEAPGEAIRQGRDPFAPFRTILGSADIRVGNLECVVASGGQAAPKYTTLRAHPRTLDVLKLHFDAVSVANNHSGDFGPAAFAEMLDLLESRGLGYFGGGRNLAEAHAPLLVERDGLRIAFLGYSEFLPRSFEADYDKPGVAWSEDEQVRLDIGQARTRHRADVVIPVMHWGWENEPLADARQRHLARLMIDAGADAVVRGHPHVIQDTETYRGKPIIYSLGNFLFSGFTEARHNTGWLLRMQLSRDGVESWRTVVARIDDEGIPHPAPEIEGRCWARGMEAAVPCAENDVRLSGS